MALVVTLLLGAAIHRAQHLKRTNASAAVPAGANLSAAAPAPTTPMSAGATVNEQTVSRTPVTMPQAPAHPAATVAVPPSDLSGAWRGEYVDAAGQRLLRVVNLNIDRIDNDGGIEGSLTYEAAGSDGACKLHARGSTYLASEHLLPQLSPEGCSPRYPKELGVPLDFDGVDAGGASLTDGRVEAPNGAAISVRLTRLTGV